MGLFSKKKGNDAGNTNAPAQDNTASKPEKKKKNELLNALDESVWESVLADLKSNTRYIMKNDDGTRKYVALMFDTKVVGGLVGKEAKGNEAKGTILEYIRTHQIKSYVRNEMLLDDSLIIIPDSDTIKNMNEFQLFKDEGVTFGICTITNDGSIRVETENGSEADDDPEIKVTFKDVLDFDSDVTKDVSMYFQSQLVAKEASNAIETPVEEDVPPVDVADVFNDEPAPEDNYEDIPTDEPDFESQNPFGQDDEPMGIADNYDDNYNAPQDDYNNQNYDNQGYDNQNYGGGQDYADGYGQDDGGYDEFTDITASVIEDYAVRHFYSDDLGLDVSDQPFDAQFMRNNQYIPFNENRGTGWLNEQLSDICKDANVRMERMHTENLFNLRTKYMEMIQDVCLKIQQSLSTSDDSTQFGRMKMAIEQNKMDNLDNISQAIQDKKEQLEQSWQDKLEAVGYEASIAAKQDYIQKFGKSHEEDMFQLESREKDEIERDYNNSIRRMNADRRAEASKLLDAGINNTLSALLATYRGMLRDEKQEQIRLQNQITKFIDSNRKDEKARIEALAEQNRQVKQANEVRKEYASKMKAMAAEFDIKKVSLQAEIDDLHRKNEQSIKKYESDSASTKKFYEDEIARLKAELQESKDAYINIHDTVEAEYSKRIEDLNNELNLRDSNMGHVIETHKRSNLVVIFGVIAAVIAAIGIGFIVGTWVNVNNVSRLEQENTYYSTYQNNGVNIQQDSDEDELNDVSGSSDNVVTGMDDSNK